VFGGGRQGRAGQERAAAAVERGAAAGAGRGGAGRHGGNYPRFCIRLRRTLVKADRTQDFSLYEKLSFIDNRYTIWVAYDIRY